MEVLPRFLKEKKKLDRIEFTSIVVFVSLACVFLSFMLGFIFSVFWNYSEDLYPCPRPNEGELCVYYNDTPPSHGEPALLFY